MEPADFMGLVKGVEAPLVLVAHPSVPATNLEQLAEWKAENPPMRPSPQAPLGVGRALLRRDVEQTQPGDHTDGQAETVSLIVRLRTYKRLSDAHTFFSPLCSDAAHDGCVNVDVVLTFTLLSVADHCLRSRNYVKVILAGKAPAPQWPGIEAAVRHYSVGLGIWD